MRIGRTIFFTIMSLVGVIASSSAQQPAVTTAPENTSVPTTAPAESVTPTANGDIQSLLRGFSPSSRILKTFDFEERALGNYEPVPMFFNKVAGRGYPSFTIGEFVHDVFRSADTSFKLQLDGGSVAYQLSPGKLPINPNADYYIIGFVKTSALPNARAELSAWFADEHGKPILNSKTHSAHWASATGKDDWHLLQIYMPGNLAQKPAPKPSPALNPDQTFAPEGLTDAKNNTDADTPKSSPSLVLQMALLQPQQLGSTLGKYELYRQDIKGAAWWDDLVVFQLPRLSLDTTAPANIFPPGKRATLNLVISELGRTKISATLRVLDTNGKLMHTQAWPLGKADQESWSQQVTLPPLPPGWYQAFLDVTDPKTILVRRQTAFAISAPVNMDTPPAREFGVIATDYPVASWRELPSILNQLGVGLVKLPAWRRDMSEAAILQKDQAFDQLVLNLQRQDIWSIASFAEVPSVLTDKLKAKNSDSILTLQDADPAIWRPYVSFILARYVNRVNLWELGRESDEIHTLTDSRFPALLKKTQQELSTLEINPRLVLPWNALFEFDPKIYPPVILDLKLPSIIKPAQIPAYIQSFQLGGAGGVSGGGGNADPATDSSSTPKPTVAPLPATEILAVIEPLDQSVSHAARVTDFVKRVVLARSANPKAVLVNLPITHQESLSGVRSEPDDLLLAYRTLVRLLGGTTYQGPLNLQPGIQALLFDRHGSGTLILWNEQGTKPEIPLSLLLGKTPVQIDYNGQTTALTPTNGLTALTVTAQPIIIDHVDTPLLQLAGSFHLGQSLFPAGVGIVQTTVELENPYPAGITGTLRVEMPKGWSMEPATFPVSLPAGAKLQQPVTIQYPFAEFAGRKPLHAKFVLDQDQFSHPLDLVTNVTIGSDIVEMECFASYTPTGDLVLQQVITNTSNATLNMQSYAMVPGMARQQRYVLDLQPGKSTIKRYNFPNGKDLIGKAAALGIRYYDGTTVLTKAIPLN